MTITEQLPIQIKEREGRFFGHFSKDAEQEEFECFSQEAFEKLGIPPREKEGCWVSTEGNWQGKRTIIWIKRRDFSFLWFRKGDCSFQAIIFKPELDRTAQIADTYFSRERTTQRLSELGLAPFPDDFERLFSQRERRVIFATLNSLVLEKDDKGLIKNVETDFSTHRVVDTFLRRTFLRKEGDETAFYIFLNRKKEGDRKLDGGTYEKIKECIEFRSKEGRLTVRKIARKTSIIPFPKKVFEILKNLGKQTGIVEIFSWFHFSGKKISRITCERDKYALLLPRYQMNLRQALDQSPMKPQQREKITKQLLAGLAKLHEAGIVHRELEFKNILLDAEGNAYIDNFDFACCREWENRRGGPALPSEPSHDVLQLGILIGLMELAPSDLEEIDRFGLSYDWKQGLNQRPLHYYYANYVLNKLHDIKSPNYELIKRMVFKEISAAEALEYFSTKAVT